jgi:hypothetical protein
MLDIQLLRNNIDGDVAARLADAWLQARPCGFPALESERKAADAYAGTAGEAQQPVEAGRRAKGEGRRCRAVMAQVAALKDELENQRGASRRPAQGTRRRGAAPQSRRTRACRRAFRRRQRRGQALGHAAHASTSRSRIMSISAKGWPARLRHRREDRRRALFADAGRSRACTAALAQFMLDTHTPSTATPRSTRPTSSTPPACAAPGSCRSSRRICSRFCAPTPSRCT